MKELEAFGVIFFCCLSDNLKVMDFKTPNPLLSQRWNQLPNEEKLAFNERARSEKVIDNAELTKHALKNIGCQVCLI